MIIRVKKEKEREGAFSTILMHYQLRKIKLQKGAGRFSIKKETLSEILLET